MSDFDFSVAYVGCGKGMGMKCAADLGFKKAAGLGIDRRLLVAAKKQYARFEDGCYVAPGQRRPV